MKMLYIVLFILHVLIQPSKTFLTDQFINEINNKQRLWIAGMNFLNEIPNKGGTENPCRSARRNKVVRLSVTNTTRYLPLRFKYDKPKYGYCSTLDDVPHQGRCANSWAVAAAASMTDRLCLRTDGRSSIQLSAEDLTTCCFQCIRGKNGCDKGSLDDALQYLDKIGIVTGDHYGYSEGCKPYTDKLFMFGNKSTTPNLDCETKCSNNNYDFKYLEDKIRSIRIHLLPRNNSYYIMRDIFNYGPSIAIFRIYKDFYAYQDGIYVPQTEEMPSWQTVNLMGWGSSNGVHFWWARNTWGKDWGKLRGFFKIRRGKNDGLIESYVYSIRFEGKARSFNEDEDNYDSSSSISLPNFVTIMLLLLIMYYK